MTSVVHHEAVTHVVHHDAVTHIEDTGHKDYRWSVFERTNTSGEPTDDPTDDPTDAATTPSQLPLITRFRSRPRTRRRACTRRPSRSGRATARPPCPSRSTPGSEMKRLLLCLTALVALTGCGDMTAQREPSAAPAAMSTSASPVAGAREAMTRTAVRTAVPTRLHLGDIDAPVEPVTLDGSTLTPPPDPHILGWWGKRSQRDAALLTGHTVHDGGTFDDLEDTPLGARARLNGHSYAVANYRVAVISKAALAERAPVLFAQSGRPKPCS